MNTIKASVIISTYNQPVWLQKTLWGYACQTEQDFEIIIADDGSTQDTKTVIDNFVASANIKVTHVWHEDNGFQKTKILNKALLKTHSEYIIFTDGDCIPRNDFIETHLSLKQDNYFLSGGYFKLPKPISDSITKHDIKQQHCFKLKWLLERGLKKGLKSSKLTAQGFKSRLLNRFTPTKATFNGMNTSGWKHLILKVNGFDERMQYGGEDRELGERLMNMGIRFKQIRYSAICVHLYHERPYKNNEAIARNKAIRSETKKDQKVWTKFGLVATEQP